MSVPPKKVFDSLKGGRPVVKDERTGHVEPYALPDNPAITVRKTASEIVNRDLTYEHPKQAERNFSRHLDNVAATVHTPKHESPKSTEEDWRKYFDETKGGESNVQDSSPSRRRYEKPEEPDLNFAPWIQHQAKENK